MPIHDQDTDPSTPGALRGLAATDPTPNPATHVSTDPGLGPGSQPPPPGGPPQGAVPGMPGVPLKATQPLPPMTPMAPVPPTPPVPPAPPVPPMGIIVPAASQVKPRKDSVELLLDGMPGPLPERPRLTPQTDGESHAAYHARHQVHPSHTNPDDEPKVVVDRPALPQTQKIDRSRVQAVIEEAEARRRAGEATAVLPPQLIGPRIVVAVVAGLVVVLALFVVVGLAGKGSGGAAKPEPVKAAATAAATTTATTAAGPTATQTAAAAGTTTASPVASSEPTATAPAATTTGTATASAKAAPPWATAPGSTRAKTPKPAATGELQDYQTKF